MPSGRRRRYGRPVPAPNPNPHPAGCRDPADGGPPPPEPPDSIAVVPYDPAWPERFDAIAAELRRGLGDSVTRLEHIGSTAVPGLAAKDLIDVLAAVVSWEAAGSVAAPAMKALGFECYWRSDEPPGHLQFVLRNGSGQRIVHVHMAPEGEPVWERVVFRDHLRAHPEEAARYMELKRSLAARHPSDRVAYARGKADYIDRVTARALQEAEG
jgi:GrpB-like predicted nucleotidyltransferase (UPF0157 family)